MGLIKNIRLIIKQKYYEKLKAFANDSYLYNYIVNNYTELPEANIFYDYNSINKIEENILFSKDNITEDDELVIQDISRDLKKSKTNYYAVIIDTKYHSFIVFKNIVGEENIPIINKSIEENDFEIIEEIEKLNKELENEYEMEG